MRQVIVYLSVFCLAFLLNSANAASVPAGFESHKFNGPVPPVTENGVTTFRVVPEGCSTVDYGDGRGESDCGNGNLKSIMRYTQDARMGETREYRFDILVDPGFGYAGYYQQDSLPYRADGWDSQLRIASWEGPFIKNFIYMLKLDSRKGVTFFGRQCQAPEEFGQWLTFSLKVRWANDEKGWVRASCNDRIVYADEGAPSTQQIQCYLSNECQPGEKRSPKSVNFILGLALNGYGIDWKVNGKPSIFSEFSGEDLQLQMRNIEVRNAAELYSAAEREQVVRLQERLNELGCDVGPADGIPGNRTREQAATCRAAAPDDRPGKLTVATVGQFLDFYSRPEVADLPVGEPQRRQRDILVAETHAERVGREVEAISSFSGRIDDLELSFIVIGEFNYSINRFIWLDLLLEDDLKSVPAALLDCPGQRTETWGDGTRHVVIQLQPDGSNYSARGGSCIIASLPTAVSEQANVLLNEFDDIALAMHERGSIGNIKHDGVRMLFEAIASGETKLTFD